MVFEEENHRDAEQDCCQGIEKPVQKNWEGLRQEDAQVKGSVKLSLVNKMESSQNSVLAAYPRYPGNRDYFTRQDLRPPVFGRIALETRCRSNLCRSGVAEHQGDQQKVWPS